MALTLPSLSGGGAAPPVTGLDARWVLSFQRGVDVGPPEAPVDFSSDGYLADIQATLPAGLDPGAFRFVLGGVSDEDYSHVKLADGQRSRVTLFLYWGDGSSGNALLDYGKSLLGVGQPTPVSASLPPVAKVAELAVTSIERKAGELRYEVTVNARLRSYDLLARRVVCGTAIERTTFSDLLQALLVEKLGLSADDYQYHAVATEPAVKSTIASGSTGLDSIRTLTSRLETAAGKWGRGMFLIRGGVLHVGPRPVPLAGDPIALDASGGLVQVEETGSAQIDPNYALCDATGAARPPAPTRKLYRLTCKGRPDIKPGDALTFTPDADGSDKADGGGLVGAVSDLIKGGSSAGGGPVTLYVESVEHRLSRADGFRSLIAGCAIDGAANAWDVHTVLNPGERPRASEQSAATPEQRAAQAVGTMMQRLVGSRGAPDVGEVRAAHPAAAGDAAAQTLDVWLGLDPAGVDAEGGQARRLDIARPPRAAYRSVPYLTPLAWGPCGLVLPQYPGSRVIVAERGGLPNDPLVLGSFWQTGHGPTNAHAGDYWLSLPVAVPDPQQVADGWVPADFGGKAVNDLIDGDGNRALEHATLSVAVGTLQKAGTRPTPSTGDPVLKLSYAGDGGASASITIKRDGSLEVHSSKGIAFSAAGGDIALDAGTNNVTIAAGSVNVKVKGTMDVSKA